MLCLADQEKGQTIKKIEVEGQILQSHSKIENLMKQIDYLRNASEALEGCVFEDAWMWNINYLAKQRIRRFSKISRERTYTREHAGDLSKRKLTGKIDVRQLNMASKCSVW